MGGQIDDANSAFFSDHFNSLRQLSGPMPTDVNPTKHKYTQPVHSSHGQTVEIQGISGVAGFSPQLVTNRVPSGQTPVGSFLEPPSVGGHVLSFAQGPGATGAVEQAVPCPRLLSPGEVPVRSHRGYARWARPASALAPHGPSNGPKTRCYAPRWRCRRSSSLKRRCSDARDLDFDRPAYATRSPTSDRRPSGSRLERRIVKAPENQGGGRGLAG